MSFPSQQVGYVGAAGAVEHHDRHAGGVLAFAPPRVDNLVDLAHDFGLRRRVGNVDAIANGDEGQVCVDRLNFAADLCTTESLSDVGNCILPRASGGCPSAQSQRHGGDKYSSHFPLPVKRHLGTFDVGRKRLTPSEIDHYLRSDQRAMRDRREGLLHMAASFTVTAAIILVSGLILGVF